MKDFMKDYSSVQSYAWNGLTGFLAWLGDQQNLMMLSLALGILTALVNMYAKCQEGKMKRRQDERAEALYRQELRHKDELHAAKLRQLSRGLRDE